MDAMIVEGSTGVYSDAETYADIWVIGTILAIDLDEGAVAGAAVRPRQLVTFSCGYVALESAPVGIGMCTVRVLRFVCVICEVYVVVTSAGSPQGTSGPAPPSGLHIHNDSDGAELVAGDAGDSLVGGA